MIVEPYQFILVVVFFIMLAKGTNGVGNGKTFFHSQQYNNDLMKLGEGWMEPGLWRPNFILDRSYLGDGDGKVLSDRIRIKLRQDKTLRLLNKHSRPKISFLWFGRQATNRDIAIDESKQAGLPSSNRIDGAWSFKDVMTANYGEVKFDILESDGDRIRHETITRWGQLDGYAAKMRDGIMYKYKFTERGIPLAPVPVGSFSVKVSPHRPILSRNFAPFE